MPFPKSLFGTYHSGSFSICILTEDDIYIENRFSIGFFLSQLLYYERVIAHFSKRTISPLNKLP